MILTPLRDIPLIHPGDDIAEIIERGLLATGIDIKENDIIVLAQKIISKAEGRYVNLTQVEPSAKAVELCKKTKKDARLLELVLQESRSILRIKIGTIITEHRLGFVCANAGIDHSNVDDLRGDPGDWVLLLPENPDHSAKEIRGRLEQKYKVKLGVQIIDSHGRAWRNGVVGITIGISGVPAV